ncbi:hypothetical protein K402DRAFT_443930 [Aulographum hederae CBS 113979]|uniref:Uncharacterized protein n=1 Tax=Aulographum hederae CBS 113979 TaxID=1176131 RepID=A0A6G1HDN6_9PEZI|nr:hypothetical protein K402DRAFT_443930 [Aulographum hederae CBS 113979]
MKSAIPAAAVALFAAVATSTYIPDVSSSLQNVLKNTHRSDLYTYPTDFTRGIIPKPLHSHNDYWRDVPYYSALSVGAVSVESDVWLVNGTLHVGHEISALTDARTFHSLYIGPILDTLKRQNPSTKFVTEETHNGVFDTSSGQTLYLWVDLKTDGPTTWPYVLEALEPLRSGGWLTTYNGSAVIPGAVTVIGTGNTPFSYFAASPGTSSSPRFTFFDAPLAKLNSPDYSNITAAISPIASTDFSASFGEVVDVTAAGGEGPLNSTQLDILRSQIGDAHAKGIGARYWDTPGFPIGTRNAIWRVLIDEGSDLINVDDLEAGSTLWKME